MRLANRSRNQNKQVVLSPVGITESGAGPEGTSQRACSTEKTEGIEAGS